MLIVFNYNTGLFDLYHDSVLIGEDLGLNSAGYNGIASHQFAAEFNRVGDLYFDNVVVAAAIPEPASAMVLAVAGVTIGCRRSRSGRH